MKKIVIALLIIGSITVFAGKYRNIGEVIGGVIQVGDYGIIIDTNGKEILTPGICVGVFGNGLAQVSNGGKDGKYKYGLIDRDGKLKAPMIYDSISDFGEGRAIIQNGEKFGFIDMNGVEITKLKFDNVSSFRCGYAKVREGERVYFINKDGIESLKELSKKYSSFYIGDFSEGIAIIEKNEKYGYVDINGKEIAAPVYTARSDSEPGWNREAYDFKNGFAIIRDKKKYGFIRKDGKVIAPKYDYEMAKVYPKYGCGVENFQYGRALVAKKAFFATNKKYGFINENGNEIIEIKYDKAESFNEKLACVTLNEKQGLIDKDGKVVVDFGKYEKIINLKEGMWGVKKNGKFAVLDETGKEITPFKYVEFGRDDRFKNGFCTIVLDNNYQNRGMIDKYGKEIIKPEYSYVNVFGDNEEYATINDMKNSRFGVFDKTGKIKWIGVLSDEPPADGD